MAASQKSWQMFELVSFGALLILPFSFLIAGCTTSISDAPQVVLKTGDSWGVAIYSSKSPYKVISYTKLHSDEHGQRSWDRHAPSQFRTIARGCYERWCWHVSATPAVAIAWEDLRGENGKACLESRSIPCNTSPWDKAFSKLYMTAVKLLGHAPLPFRAHIVLLPEGDGYHAIVSKTSPSYVPLEFGFGFPTDGKAPGYAKQATRALIHVVVTVGYELQHVEYAAHETLGPTKPILAKAVKDEANSACWKLAAEAQLTRWASLTLSLPEESATERQITREIVGQKPDFSSAAVLGPKLLRRGLDHYLVQHYASIEENEIKIPPDDTGTRNELLAYCRAFARYKGNILRQPMPTAMIDGL